MAAPYEAITKTIQAEFETMKTWYASQTPTVELLTDLMYDGTNLNRLFRQRHIQEVNKATTTERVLYLQDQLAIMDGLAQDAINTWRLDREDKLAAVMANATIAISDKTSAIALFLTGVSSSISVYLASSDALLASTILLIFVIFAIKNWENHEKSIRSYWGQKGKYDKLIQIYPGWFDWNGTLQQFKLYLPKMLRWRKRK